MLAELALKVGKLVVALVIANESVGSTGVLEPAERLKLEDAELPMPISPVASVIR